MKLSRKNTNITKDEDDYFRINIEFGTHHFHSEKLNLKTALRVRDDLIENEEIL